MNLIDVARDPFRLFRFILGIIVTVYCAIITLQSLWGWYVWLAGSDKYIGLLRRYVLVQGLRLRFRSFWGDVIICILLCIAFALLWRAQIVMDGLEELAGSLHAGRIGHS